jgi:hypothetical protein
MAQHFGRVDQVINDKNHAFVSYNRYCLYALQNITFGKPLAIFIQRRDSGPIVIREPPLTM